MKDKSQTIKDYIWTTKDPISPHSVFPSYDKESTDPLYLLDAIRRKWLEYWRDLGGPLAEIRSSPSVLVLGRKEMSTFFTLRSESDQPDGIQSSFPINQLPAVEVFEKDCEHWLEAADKVPDIVS